MDCKTGIVKAITGHGIEVEFVRNAACKECHAKGACNAIDEKHMLITSTHYPHDLSVGDQVEVHYSERQGLVATLWAFVLPLAMLLLLLPILLHYSVGEALSALICLGVLVVYYLLLYMMRPHFSRKFSFHITRKLS